MLARLGLLQHQQPHRYDQLVDREYNGIICDCRKAGKLVHVTDQVAVVIQLDRVNELQRLLTSASGHGSQ
jgi:hypothetical protein